VYTSNIQKKLMGKNSADKVRDWELDRLRMVEGQLKSRGISDERVLQAMGKVPRHKFVPQDCQESAYTDGPLPIGEGQTVSQPYMVGIMTQCLELKGEEKVLEVGTGSGYQSAVLMELARELFTIERIPSLAERAKSVLSELSYDRFHLKVADGTKGWPEEAPFDGIIVTAGAPVVPETLIDQLNEGGRMVIPVGSRFSQRLYKTIKKAGKIIQEEDTMCVFVPLIGEYGWDKE
jgi:protein-L-isoaspartate(D-aspartate) O-methyltransferase